MSPRNLFNFVWVIVLALATSRLSAQTPILEFRFNEAGTVVTNTGSVATNLTMLNTAGTVTNLHGSAGSGVTGAADDYAFDNTASASGGGSGGEAASATSIPALAGLRSFTLTGWVRGVNLPTVNLARMIRWSAGAASGFDLGFGSGSTMSLYVNNVAVGSGAITYPSFTNANDWTFFAVSWDGTAGSSNVKFFRGTPINLAAPGTATLAQTIVTNSATFFCLGNEYYRARAFDGWMDDIRVFGSTNDSRGALAMYQLDYIRQQTFRPLTNMNLYVAAGTFAVPLTNLLDNEETTYLSNPGNDGALICDRYTTKPFYDFGLTCFNSAPLPGNYGPPQSWRIEVQANDDPAATNGWKVLAAVTNVFGVAGPLTVNVGRRVTFEPVTNRYVRWVNTFSGDPSVLASMDFGRQVYVYACSNNVDGGHPYNYATDGKSNTFANVGFFGTSTNTGVIILDVLRTNKNDYVTQLRLQHRIDASSTIWPKDYTVSVSSTDDPANFDIVVAAGQFDTPVSPTDRGRWWTIELGRQPKRFYRFAWSDTWQPMSGVAQFAEIAVTSINWVRKGTLTTLK